MAFAGRIPALTAAVPNSPTQAVQVLQQDMNGKISSVKLSGCFRSEFYCEVNSSCNAP